MILLIEIAVLCLLMTGTTIIGTKKNPVRGIHNLPLPIQERVHALPQYTGKIHPIMSSRKRIMKKTPLLIIVLIFFTGLVLLAGAKTFLTGLLYSFILWAGVKCYSTLALDCGWYAHTKAAWILGTEDMESDYKNYKFYLGSIPRSLLAGGITGAVVGIIIMLIYQ